MSVRSAPSDEQPTISSGLASDILKAKAGRDIAKPPVAPTSLDELSAQSDLVGAVTVGVDPANPLGPGATGRQRVSALIHQPTGQTSGEATLTGDEEGEVSTGESTMTDTRHPPHAGPDAIATRREGQDTREQLDEKIRAHLDKSETKKDPLLGQTVGGRFLVLKKIGSGGMGSVYRARQEGMDRDVAIKVLLGDLTQNETVLRRFTLEALAVSRLRHPNTIQIFDYGQTPDGNPYIAMEMLEGLTLFDLLRKERPLPIRRALRIMAQVAHSLAEAHEKEIVHRDLKPENIFLVRVADNPDYVKVLDFGVAKLRDHKNEQGTLTQAGSIFGTPRYMSPEQCSAQPVDSRSDIYTLGVILYEMITGQPPFSGDQALSLLLAHVNDPPPPPSSATDKQIIPAEVEELVLRLLEKEPVDRIQNASEFGKRCEELAAALPAAFDQCVGTAEEAESLGVRVSLMTTDQLPTSRTLRLGKGALVADKLSSAPTLEPVQLQAPKASKMPLIVGGVAAVVALGVAGWVVTREPEVITVEKDRIVERERQVPVPALAADNKVRVTVTSNPPGAQILNGSVMLGTTPATLEHDKGGADEKWQLVLKGYQPETLQVGFARDAQFGLELKALGGVKLAEPRPDLPTRPRTDGKPADLKVGEPGKAEAKTDQKVETKPLVKAESNPEPKGEPKTEPKAPPKKNDLVDDLQ